MSKEINPIDPNINLKNRTLDPDEKIPRNKTDPEVLDTGKVGYLGRFWSLSGGNVTERRSWCS